MRFRALLVLALVTSIDAFAAMTVPSKLDTGENSLVQKVVLRGNEICADTPVARGSPEELVRRHTVSLLLNGQHQCTGTIVKENRILTARHCAELGIAASAYTVRVYIEGQGYRNIGVKRIVRSTSLDRIPDVALLQLMESVPSVNVIQPAMQPCDRDEFVQAGFGLNELGKSGACLRTASHTSTRPPPRRKGLPGITVPAAMDLVFYGVPKVKNTTGCGGDSGGPIFCKVSGRWSYAGLFLAVVAKENDWDWAEAETICNDDQHPDRDANCVRSCELSIGVTGYWTHKIKSVLEEMNREMDVRP